MRELDALLLRYLENVYPRAPLREREAFEQLLELPDPQLFGYLVGREPAPGDSIRDVVARIRSCPD
jgi:antitoxin CptB